MEFSIEPSPRGGYAVRLAGHPTPVSHHDTEEEAEARVAAYEHGMRAQAPGPAAEPPRFAALPDGTQLLLRSLEPDDGPLLEGLCDDRSFLTELDHVDREALVALDPRNSDAVALARYTRRRDDDASAVVVYTAREAWRDAAVERVLRARLAEHARTHGIDVLM